MLKTIAASLIALASVTHAVAATEADTLKSENRLLKAQITLLKREVARLRFELTLKHSRPPKRPATRPARKAARAPTPRSRELATMSASPAVFKYMRMLHDEKIASLRRRIRTEKNSTARRGVMDDLRRALASNGGLPTLTRLAVGRFGRLYDSRVRIRQIVNAEEMLADILTRILPPGDNTWRTTKHLVWIKGLDISARVDKSVLTATGPFIVTGTKQYETVGGSTSTIFLLEPVDGPTWQKAYDAWCAKAKSQ